MSPFSSSIAGLADTLLMVAVAALVRRGRQAGQRCQLLAIANPPPAEKLHHVQPALLGPMPRSRSSWRTLPTGSCRRGANPPGALVLQILDLPVHERPALILAQQRCCSSAGTACPSQVPQLGQLLGKLAVDVGHRQAASGQQSLDAIAVLRCAPPSAPARSRCSCRRSSSAALGTCTTLQTFRSPCCQRISMLKSLPASRRSVLRRRPRRFTSMEDESTTLLLMPWLARKRCNQKPSRPAS